jgi:prepilin-type N-terminal cleavage/methylation domain-containing protein
MTRNHTTRAGFTLIELSITVAIMGILAASAITIFSLQQLRAKRTEAMTNLAAIAKLETGYFGVNGTYPDALAAPSLPPGEKQNWDALAEAEFAELGFKAEGTVWYIYDVNTPESGCACPNCFTATAYGDSDRDASVAFISYFHGAAPPVCPTMIGGHGPPIDPDDGQPILNQPVAIPPGPGADDY